MKQELDQEYIEMSTEEFEAWIDSLDKDRSLFDKIKRVFISSAYYIKNRLARRYPLTKEHREAGLIWSDAPKYREAVWNAYRVIAWQAYPILLKYRRAEKAAMPPNELSEEEWDDIVDKMLFSLYVLCDEQSGYDADPGKVNVGLQLFHQYFTDLWD